MSTSKSCPECGETFSVPYASDPRTYCSRSCSAKQWARRRTLDVNSNWRGGKTKHPLYHTYNDMVGRCTRPTHARFADYGGRGITVCDRWRADFWNFVADMGERPAGRSIDRIDNDRGYAPDNCRWATAKEQRANRRRQCPKTECKSGHEFTPENTSITTDGKRRCKTCVNQWARDARVRRAA